MGLAAVHAAVSARLEVGWHRCPVVPLNAAQSETPANGSAFLAVQYPVLRQDQISTGAPGSNVFRTEGVLRLVLNVESGAGLNDALAWSDELVALFRAKQFDGVRTFAPSPPAIDDRNRSGNYFTCAVAVPFEFDELG